MLWPLKGPLWHSWPREALLGLHDVTVHGELEDVLHVVCVPRQRDETFSQLLKALLLPWLHFHVENLHDLAWEWE